MSTFQRVPLLLAFVSEGARCVPRKHNSLCYGGTWQLEGSRLSGGDFHSGLLARVGHNERLPRRLLSLRVVCENERC